MQDVVDRIINLHVHSTEDFEWQYKLKTQWDSEDHGKVACGGWSMRMGYEYLGSSQRLLMMPITERYFVFIASSLREKNAVMFQCIPENQTASEIVEEFASFSAMPFLSVQCEQNMSLGQIT